MNEKKIKSLLSALGMPAEKQETFITELKDDSDGVMPTEKEFLAQCKDYGLKISQSEIDKKVNDAKQSASAGAILKSLNAVYKNLKANNETDLSFEDWKKSKESTDYADLIEENLTNARQKGVSNEDAIKQLNKKLEDVLTAKKKAEDDLVNFKKEVEEDNKNKLKNTILNKKLNSFEQKPIKAERTFELFKKELEAKYNIDLDGEGENLDTILKDKESNSIAIKDSKLITIQDEWNNYYNENQYEFQVSGGAQKSGAGAKGEGSQVKEPTVNDKGNLVLPSGKEVVY